MPDWAAIISERKPAFGWGLRCLLEEEAGLCPVYTAACIEEACHVAARDPKVRLLVVDLAVDGMRYADGLQRLRQLHPDIYVVILTEPGNTAYVPPEFASAGDAFLPADAPLASILRAFRAAVASDHPDRRPVLPVSTTSEKSTTVRMSRRQAQVIDLVAAGSSNKNVARALNVAEGTVKAHVAAAYRKLGVTNRTAACRKLLDVAIAVS